MSMESRRAMDGIELAIRRVSFRLKSRTPWDMSVTEALDELADEIGGISCNIDRAIVEDAELRAAVGSPND